MVIEIIASIYCILIGIAIIIMWILLIRRREVPELNTQPTRIYFHLVSEFLTGIILIIGGIGLLINQTWGLAIFFLSLGMVIYSMINAAGYYGQLKEWPMFIMFIVFTIVSALIATAVIFS
ncbi:MAG: hypothetical protein ACFFDN_29775 [Candidatus Hodarchaeota archaeon]